MITFVIEDLLRYTLHAIYFIHLSIQVNDFSIFTVVQPSITTVLAHFHHLKKIPHNY